VVRVELQADQLPAVGQGPSQPDCAVPAERSDLENAARVDRSRDHMQELTLRRGHRDVRQCGAVLDRRFEHRIGGLEEARGVCVDGVPAIIIHGAAV
jgi:hypothetical protein